MDNSMSFWQDVLPPDEWMRVHQRLPDLISISGNMKTLGRRIAVVAKNKSTVLLCGESGVGKEIFAQAIHALSPRAHKPFVAVNCTAVTETLLESEFFGHERGAFTGADTQKKGLWEVATGGTLFLDEIGDLPLHSQAKILRAIETGKIRRVGGNNEISVDVRIVAATSVELDQAVQDGRFRGDLYYRLNVVPFVIPPLRERPEDIPLLVEYFLSAIAEKIGIDRIPSISDATMDGLIGHAWRGNIRELEHAIERALSMGYVLETLEMEHFGISQSVEQALSTGYDFGISQSVERIQTLSEIMDEFERRVIMRVLAEAKGNQTHAARHLGVHRNTIVDKVKRYQLQDYIAEVSLNFKGKKR